MECIKWCCQLQRDVVIRHDAVYQFCIIVRGVFIEERKVVLPHSEECELCRSFLSNRDTGQGDSRLHLEGNVIQSEEVAIVGINRHDAVKRCSQVAEGVRKLRNSFRTLSATQNCRYMSCEVVSS